MSNIIISTKEVNNICLGRRCSKKKECLRYTLYNNTAFNEKGLRIVANSCNFNPEKPNFIDNKKALKL